MRHCGWLEYLADYTFTMHYHPGKMNVVADALSRRSYATLFSLSLQSQEIFLDFYGLLQIRSQESRQHKLFSLVACPFLLAKVKESQFGDEKVESFVSRLMMGQSCPGGHLIRMATY